MVAEPVEVDTEPANEILEANRAFYRAFEQGDIEALVNTWAHTDEVLCAHPGRAPLRGWPDVVRSWQLIVGAGNQPQMILTDETVTVRGETGWVTVTENMLTNGRTAVAAAVNIFERIDGRWLMVAHHAGPVV